MWQLSGFSPKCPTSMTIFCYKNVMMQNVSNFVSIIYMNFIQNYIIYGNTCKHDHKKWQYKNSHIDLKYHITGNTIFSIVTHHFYCISQMKISKLIQEVH